MVDIDVVPKRRSYTWLWVLVAIVAVALLIWVFTGRPRSAARGLLDHDVAQRRPRPCSHAHARLNDAAERKALSLSMSIPLPGIFNGTRLAVPPWEAEMIKIVEFPAIASASGDLYRPRVYGDPTGIGCDGYVVFFPLGVGNVISTPRETTQPTFEALEHWASTLDTIYLDGALTRALDASTGVAFPLQGGDLSAQAAAEAIALHRTAERVGAEAASEAEAAEMHERAAADAREHASELAREYEGFQELADETTRASAESVAEAHESAARKARRVAGSVSSKRKAKGTSRKRRK